MYVIKRSGAHEPFQFDQITARIRAECDSIAGSTLDPGEISQKVIAGMANGMTTSHLDRMASEIAAEMITRHPDYGILAARLTVSNMHKQTPGTFAEAMTALHFHVDRKTGIRSKMVSDEIQSLVTRHRAEIEDRVDYARDYRFSYFGLRTLMHSYLFKIDGQIAERPQHLWMRVALGIHGEDLASAFETYDLMSMGLFTHASPTLYNSGTPVPQLSSCFLLKIKADSIDGIYETLMDTAKISKRAGGIGISAHGIRAKGSSIFSTNGTANGLVPMLKVYDSTAHYVDQGGNKRPGAFAVYIEPWHADIYEFLDLKKNTGKDELRARNLFYGMWIPDLFMKRVRANMEWSLFCPNEARGLAENWGKKFELLYTQYENTPGLARRVVKAQHLWRAIMVSQIETGGPYMLYKDACNGKSNQQNLGTIQSSNLCVAPETRILTDLGHVRISDHAGKVVNVWNGEEWSPVTVVQTGTKQPLIRVELSNGAIIHCTPYHKFLVQDLDKRPLPSIRKASRMEAKDLVKGMKLAKWEAPVLQGDSSLDILTPYEHGFFCGLGTYEECDGVQLPVIVLESDRRKMAGLLHSISVAELKTKTTVFLSPKISPRFHVPHGASLDCRLDWLTGFMDSTGHISTSEGNKAFQLTFWNFAFLDEVRLMLLTMGVHSKIVQFRGINEEHPTRRVFRFNISSTGLQHLVGLGMVSRHTIMGSDELQRSSERYVTVTSVTDEGRVDDTYCFTEILNNAGVFEGTLTGNCTEIIEYTAPDEIAVCNLASIALPMFVDRGDESTGRVASFDYGRLMEVTGVVTRNLNRIIDINSYPVPEAATSNRRNRPIGIGVQGLADVFIMMGLPFDSPKARALNMNIFEAIYYGALEASCELARDQGTYETYEGSPVSRGLLQQDMWPSDPYTTPKQPWDRLRAKIAVFGLRNSLLVAPMPTASTAQILGNTECFEPIPSNIYTRSVLSGQFKIVNQHLVTDLVRLGLWSEEMKNKIIAATGSVQKIGEIPENLREIYRTIWEISQKNIIDMAADRGRYIDQSQSLSIYMSSPTYEKLTSMHFYGWEKGLKTGMYYLRMGTATSAVKFTVAPEVARSSADPSAKVTGDEAGPACSRDNPNCDSCGS